MIERDVEDELIEVNALMGMSVLGAGLPVDALLDVVLIATGCDPAATWLEIAVALLPRPDAASRTVFFVLEMPTWLPMPEVPTVVPGTSGTIAPPAVAETTEVDVTPD